MATPVAAIFMVVDAVIGSTRCKRGDQQLTPGANKRSKAISPPSSCVWTLQPVSAYNRMVDAGKRSSLCRKLHADDGAANKTKSGED